MREETLLTQKVAPDWSGKALRAAEERRNARAHLSKCVEDSVQYDEQREDSLEGIQCASDNESKDLFTVSSSCAT